MSLDTFIGPLESAKDRFREYGMAIVEDILSEEELVSLRKDLERAMDEECKFQGSTQFQDYGMVLVCAKYGGSLLSLFEKDHLFRPTEDILGSDCIVYANTSSSIPPRSKNYANRIHVDGPEYFPGYCARISCLFMIDDFTIENGATYFLPKSIHASLDIPAEDFFYKHALRLTGKAGTVVYWDPTIWHAGGVNDTDKWRHALTVVMCRSYMKQRLNFSAMIDKNLVPSLSPSAKQRLGFFSIPPNSYEEYYAPRDRGPSKVRTGPHSEV